MIQVYLVLVLQLVYTTIMWIASPKNDRVANYAVNLTQVLFTAYTCLVIVVNSLHLSPYAAQTVFGNIMSGVLLFIVFINVVYIVYSAFLLIRTLIRALGRKTLLEKREIKAITEAANEFDYSSLKQVYGPEKERSRMIGGFLASVQKVKADLKTNMAKKMRFNRKEDNHRGKDKASVLNRRAEERGRNNNEDGFFKEGYKEERQEERSERDESPTKFTVEGKSSVIQDKQKNTIDGIARKMGLGPSLKKVGTPKKPRRVKVRGIDLDLARQGIKDYQDL